MKLLNKLMALKSVLLPQIKAAYSNKLLEQKLNDQGLDVSIDSKCTVIETIFEKHVRLFGSVRIAKSSVGSFTYIQSDANISYATIGKFCSIGPRTIIAHGEHPTNFISSHPLFFSEFSWWSPNKFVDEKIIEQHSQVTIGHDVWIGANCYIKDGVTIGTGSVIAAGSVVVKDIPTYTIAGGIPAKTIRARFSSEITDQLLKSEWWLLETDQLIRLKHFFQIPISEKTIIDFVEKISSLKRA
jgi:acetyltransferase-like isoleucine patch superfamily enzyme